MNKWCTDKLIKNKGVLDVVVPAALKAGDYIMRSEINALHNGNAPGGAQFYIFWWVCLFFLLLSFSTNVMYV